MALQPCRECGQPVSTEAVTCPRCGVPQPTTPLKASELPKDTLQVPGPLDPPRPGGNAFLRVAGVVLGCIVIIGLATNYGRDASSKVRSGGAQQLTLSPVEVTLDYRANEMEIRGVLVKEPGSRAPMQVWIWAHFINSGEGAGGSRSDEPIWVPYPFSEGGDTARVTARGPFHWATNVDAPKDGYYARISVSSRSAEHAKIPVRNRDYSPLGMTRVVSER